ncbi:hypothetical protein JOD43_001518 [Pullulanibacillus pueri]|uniref:Transglutaminase-like domain-containing protein n=1 Tax=Pullulanibacillus pueri TaxID=1437324 RepID=A0A8J2ZUJ7_9BACL|nr:transglutaminase-like domain-containing protein [Pullulanibacillus pueri]MBM7681351.1 hypothetical protein [Pullulanibacillus pueri]GGH77491.1 hypothetical protein GCM10007096_09460 [Pullulanibacillus pueri]
MKKRLSLISGLGLLMICLLVGCTPLEQLKSQGGPSAEETSGKHLNPIELSAYAKDVGAHLEEPQENASKVQSAFTLSGKIKDQALNGQRVWVRVTGPQHGTFDYYIPIKKTTFKQTIRLFEGKGQYQVVMNLPNKGQKNSFYEMTTFNVTNTSSKITRDIEKTPDALDADLKLTAPLEGYSEAKDKVKIQGQISEKYNGQYLMVQAEKDQKKWDTMVLVNSGTFATDFPLKYGAGNSKITVMVPYPKREHYYLDGATFIVNNSSKQETTASIEYFQDYFDEHYQLDEPVASGEKTGKTFHISGTYDVKAGKNAKIDQLIVEAKKGKLTSTYLIPAQDGRFAGDFYLRFGSGNYQVTVAIPDDPGSYHSYFKYSGIAQFSVTSDAKDERDLLPSRGIQSDAPEIKQLAATLTKGKPDQKSKAKAIYDYVAKNVTYDMDKYHKDLFKLDDSALRTLSTKKGVCQDYVFLTVALLRAAGIESHYITGEAGGRHAWVEAKLNGKWVTMDPTWGSGYVQNDSFVKHYDPSYFDPNMTEFNKTHKQEEIVY